MNNINYVLDLSKKVRSIASEKSYLHALQDLLAVIDTVNNSMRGCSVHLLGYYDNGGVYRFNKLSILNHNDLFTRTIEL